MKKFLFLLFPFLGFSQSAATLQYLRNSTVDTISPNIVTVVDTPTNPLAHPLLNSVKKTMLKWNQNQIIGLQDSLDLKLNKTSIASWAKQPNKPTYTWSEIGEKPTIPTNQTLSLLDRTLSISDGNSVTLPSTAIIISNPMRSFNTNFNMLNTTLVFYSIKIENGTALVSATTGTAYLEYSVNGGTSWITVSQVMREENGLSLLNINTKGSTFVLSGIIPGGSLARIRTNALAGSSITLLSTQENAF